MTNTLDKGPSLADLRTAMAVELKGGYLLTELGDDSLIVEGRGSDGALFAFRVTLSEPWPVTLGRGSRTEVL